MASATRHAGPRGHLPRRGPLERPGSWGATAPQGLAPWRCGSPSAQDSGNTTALPSSSGAAIDRAGGEDEPRGKAGEEVGSCRSGGSAHRSLAPVLPRWCSPAPERAPKRSRRWCASACGNCGPGSRRTGADLLRRRRIERCTIATCSGVATTSALEMGIDVSGLDAVLVTGWPGTRASFCSRWGRRAERAPTGSLFSSRRKTRWTTTSTPPRACSPRRWRQPCSTHEPERTRPTCARPRQNLR